MEVRGGEVRGDTESNMCTSCGYKWSEATLVLRKAGEVHWECP